MQQSQTVVPFNEPNHKARHGEFEPWKNKHDRKGRKLKPSHQNYPIRVTPVPQWVTTPYHDAYGNLTA